MPNKQYQARVPEGLADEVDEYCEENYYSESEVVRKALRELVLDNEPNVVETRLVRGGRDENSGERRGLIAKVREIFE